MRLCVTLGILGLASWSSPLPAQVPSNDILEGTWDFCLAEDKPSVGGLCGTFEFNVAEDCAGAPLARYKLFPRPGSLSGVIPDTSFTFIRYELKDDWLQFGGRIDPPVADTVDPKQCRAYADDGSLAGDARVTTDSIYGVWYLTGFAIQPLGGFTLKHRD